jgi:hypothetical protein
VGIVLPAFQKKRIKMKTYFLVSKPARLKFAGFQKLLVQLREICNPIGAKDLNLPILKSFQQVHKILALNS